MLFYRKNKKSQLRSFLANVLLTIVAFLLIVAIFEVFKGQAEAKATESICRESVVLREKYFTEIRYGIIHPTNVATPLLCRTIDKYIPENKDATKLQVENEIADLMTKCWHQFGEGRIEDVFKEDTGASSNCFVCYNLNLRETSKFKGEIKNEEFLHYLFETPYKANEDGDFCKPNGGFCMDVGTSTSCGSKIPADPSYLLIDKKNDVCNQKNKKACCYTEYGCWNKGGICSKENPDTNKYYIYNDWDCPSKTNCYIKKENYFSYGDYIQKYGGEGRTILTDIKPGETYAISFGSPNTKTYHWSNVVALGVGLGVGAKVAAVGLTMVSGPVGWIVVGVSAVVIGAGSYAITRGASEKVVDFASPLIWDREVNTLYVMPLSQMQQYSKCSIVKDIREK